MPTANGGNINFGINMTVNKNGLNQVLKPLQQIQTRLNSLSTDHIDKEFQEAANSAKQLESIINSSWNDKLGQLNLDKFNQSITTSYGSVSNLKNILSGVGAAGQSAFNALASQVLNTNLQLKESNKLLDDMATSMANTVKWSITSSIVNNISGAIQKAFYYAKDLDTSLNDIRIVTGDSADQMERFAKTANNAAKDLGRSTLDYTKAALSYYQQGLSADQVAARTEVTLKAQNITGAGSEMADYLTAVWNGFGIQADQTEQIVDKLAKVADSSASNMSELAIAMSKVASVANVMGVDVDQLTAQLATVIATTRQAPESVGTAFKTIYTRLNDIKTGADGAEVSLGNYSGQMAALGFNVLDANGSLRDTGQVIEQIGGRWDTLTKQQQVYLAQTMGGMRQVNQVMALFEGWATYSELLNDSLSAQGTLNEKNNIYLESTAAHMEQLRAEAERTYDVLFDQKVVNNFVDIFKTALGAFNDYIAGIGGGVNVFINLGATVANIFNKQIGSAINAQIKNIELLKNNLAQIKAQQDFSQTIRNNATDVATVSQIGSNESVSTAALERQAAITQETLKVRKALSQQQYNELQTLQKQVGQLQTKIDYLNQYKVIGREVLDDENASTVVFKARLDAEKEILEVEKAQIKVSTEYLTNLQLGLSVEQSSSLLLHNLKDIENNRLLSEKQRIAVITAIYKLTNGQELTQEQIRAVLEAQQVILKQQEAIVNRVNQGYQGRKAAEDGTTKAYQAQRDAAERIAKQQQDQAARQLQIQRLVTKITGGVQAASAAMGSFKTALDESATASEKVNGVWQGITGTIAGVFNMIAPGSGFLIQGLGSLIKTSLEIVGIWDTIVDNFTSLDEKLDKINQKVKQVGQIDSSGNKKISSIQALAEEYSKLSIKAGQYGQNVSKMTAEQQNRYYELTDTFASYNDSVILGYDAQGHAIVNNQTLVEDLITLLKKEQEEAAKAALGTSKEINSMIESKNAAFGQADQKLANAQTNLQGARNTAFNDQTGSYAQVAAQSIDMALSNLQIMLQTLDEEGKQAVKRAGVSIRVVNKEILDAIRSGTGQLSVEDLQKWTDIITTVKTALSNNENFSQEYVNELILNPILEIANVYSQTNQIIQQAQEKVNAAQAEVDKLAKEGQKFDTYFIKQVLQYSDDFGANVKTLLAQEDIDPQITNLLWEHITGFRYFKDIEGGINISEQQASSYEAVLAEGDRYAQELLQVFLNRKTAIELVQEQAAKTTEELSSQSELKAKDINQNIVNSIKNLLNSDTIKQALKDQASKDVIEKIIKSQYNLEDLTYAYDEQGNLISAQIKTQNDELISKIAQAFMSGSSISTKLTDADQQSLINWLKETYNPDQIISIFSQLDNVMANYSWHGFNSFKEIVQNLFAEEQTTKQADNLIANINKVESVIKKLASDRDLTIKEKFNLMDLLGFTEEDIQSLNNQQDLIRISVEKINELLKDKKDERIQLLVELFPTLNTLKAAGLEEDPDWTEIWDNVFQNELESLNLTKESLLDYARIKGIAFKSQEDILNIYKVSQSFSQLTSIISSTKDEIVKYKESGEGLEQIYENINAISTELQTITGDTTTFTLEYVIENIQAVSYALEQGATDLDSFLEKMAEFDEFKEKIQSISESFGELKEKLYSGSDLSDSEVEKLKQTLEDLVQLYPEVADAAQVLTDTWLSGTDMYKQALEEVSDAIYDLNMSSLSDQLEQIFYNLEDGLSDLKIGVDPTDFNEWADEVENFLDIDRKISIEVYTNAMEEFDLINAQMDAIYDAAGKIGQGFIVAAQDIRELNNVFPGIMQGMQMLDDGSYQLNSNIVQRAISTAQISVDADANSVAEQLQNQAQYFREKASIYRQIEHAAAVLAGDQIDIDLNANQAKQTIAKNLEKIKKEYSADAAKQENTNQKEIVDGSKVSAQSIAHNYAGAMNVSASAVFRFASVAVQNLTAVATAVAAALSGQMPSLSLLQTSINSWFSGIGGIQAPVSSAIEKIAQTALTTPSVENYRRLAQEAAAQAEFNERLARDAEGAAAETRGRERQVDTGLGNVSRGEGVGGTKPTTSGSSSRQTTPKTSTTRQTTPKTSTTRQTTPKTSTTKETPLKDTTEKEEKYVKEYSAGQKELLDEVTDRYHDINNALKDIERTLKHVQDQQKKYLGLGLIQNLERQLQILEDQKNAQQQKLKLQRQERTELQKILSQQGVRFNDNGTVANYGAALERAMDETNFAITAYNDYIKQIDWQINNNPDMTEKSKDQLKATQDFYKAQQEAAIKQYNTFKENLERYDELTAEQIEDTKDKIQELSDQEIELKIKKSKILVEIRLEVEDFKRDWIKFKRNVLEGLTTDDVNSVVRNSQTALDLAKTYYDPTAALEQDKGTLYTSTQKIGQLVQIINKIQAGDYSTDYGDNIAQAFEDLKDYQSKAMDAASALKDLVKEVTQNVLDSIDQAKSAFDDHINQYDHVSKKLQHQAKIIQLIYGDKAYDLMDQYYEAQQLNINASIEFLKAEKEKWKELLDAELAYRETLAEDSDEYAISTEKIKKFKQNFQKAAEDANAAVEKALSNLVSKYTNSINKVFYELEKKLTGGSSFERIGEEWQLINKRADMYLDNVNRIYEIDKLRGVYEQTIAGYSNNLKAQKSLTEMMKEQLKYLEDKEKISRYDIDRANALLDIEVKRLALQEQRQQKSKLRLRRDSQGNYTYEYTSDEEQVSTARQDLLDAQNDLYNMTKQHYKENLEDYYKTLQQMNDKIKEVYLDSTLSEEERNARVLEIRERYEPILNDLANDNVTLRKNLYEDAVNALVTLYETSNQSARRSANDTLKQVGESSQSIKKTAEETTQEIRRKAEEMVNGDTNGIVALWDSGIQKMIDRVQEEGGLQPIYDEAVQKMEDATKQLQKDIDELQEASGEDFKEIGTAIDQTTKETIELKDANTNLIDVYTKLIEKSWDLYKKTKALWEMFLKNEDGMLKNIQAGKDLLTNIERVTEAYKELTREIERAAKEASQADFTIRTTRIDTHIINEEKNGQTSTSSDMPLATPYEEPTIPQPVITDYKANEYTTPAPTSYTSAPISTGGWSGGYSGGGYSSGGGSSQSLSDYVNSFGGGQSYDVITISSVTPAGYDARGYRYSVRLSNGQTREIFGTRPQVGALASAYGFASGGYTGDWGSNEGRMAVLHEKELVLNKEDTKNILSAVNVVRAIQGVMNSLISRTQLPSPMNLLSGFANASSGQDLNQYVSIEAHFPNVTNSGEIEMAFNNLVNQASQYIHQHSY